MSIKVEDDRDNLDDFFKELKYLQNHKIIIGVLSDDEVDGISVKDYSLYLEFGTDHIPARPFFRTATQTTEAKKKISRYMDKELQKVMKGKKTAEQACDAIGKYIVGLIQKSIKYGNWTPNAPGTIKQKTGAKKNNPLIDTTTMIKSIDYEIRRK